jgi:hypothetical protein
LCSNNTFLSTCIKIEIPIEIPIQWKWRKKQLTFEKYNTKFNEEATISGTQLFVNAAKLFQNGKLDSADEGQQVLTYQ